MLASCGKEEPQPTPEARKAAASKPPAEKKPPPEAPQGKLPHMDPEKAKFIAQPSTPKDNADEVKKAEVKPATVAAPEIKKPAPQEVRAITPKEPEVKKAEVK